MWSIQRIGLSQDPALLPSETENQESKSFHAMLKNLDCHKPVGLLMNLEFNKIAQLKEVDQTEGKKLRLLKEKSQESVITGRNENW